MGNANESKIFFLLLDEIDDTLVDIETRCLKLETSDQASELQVLFRAAHNIKGAAQLYGLSDLASLVHNFEDLLTALQVPNASGKPDTVTVETIDVMLSTQSFLRGWVTGLRENGKFSPNVLTVREQINDQITQIKNSRRAASDPAPARATPAPSPAASKTEPPTKMANESVAIEAPPTTIPTPTASVPSEAPLVEPTGKSGKKKKSKSERKANETIRVPTLKIDEIIQFIGELSINQGILNHNLKQGTLSEATCRNPVELNQKALKELYDLILTLRMQSADPLFQRVERTVRDLARSQKKPIHLEFSGADTPLDKIVIEMITDPMMHLVRNAVDHGIEDEATRRNSGKSLTASLSIQTRQEGGQVIISVSDDGRGLDPNTILQKAVKLGLVPPGKRLAQAEILNLICLPGFTTRDTVTQISGRGVGMDVVQKVIDSLGGHLEITSEKGKGTTFHINLPANLEIIEGLTVKVTNQLYIVPRQEVTEIIDLSEYDVRRMGDGGRAIHLRGAVVPVEELSDYIGIEAPEAPTPPGLNSRGRKQIALVTRLEKNNKVAICIDELVDQRQIVVRPLSDQLSKVPCFSGVTILGNGEPAMILNMTVIGASYLKWIGNQSVEGGPSQRNYGETA